MEIAQSLVRHGAGLMFANVLAQQLGVPIPAEPTLVLAGALAAKGMLSPFRVIAATVVATALAGARHVKLASFLFYDLTGIVLWASLPVTGGMLFHHQAETLLSVLTSRALSLAVVALVVSSAVPIGRRWLGRGRSQWAPRS